MEKPINAYDNKGVNPHVIDEVGQWSEPKKKKIRARIIADSLSPQGNRITTFVVTCNRWILAELNTHRAFSRNSASSRAIPFEKMVRLVLDDPFIPIAWQKDHKGMQGTEYFNDEQVKTLVANHLRARDRAVAEAVNQSTFGVTKQICNRYLEPFMWHTAIITATEWENFFALRCPQYQWVGEGDSIIFRSKKDYIKYHNSDPADKKITESDVDWKGINLGQGEIHIMALAEAMWDAMNESTPRKLQPGEWHIPFGNNISSDVNRWEFIAPIKDLWGSDLTPLFIKVATARCARVSYLNFEGKDDYAADIKLHDQLLSSGHMSPFEHCAKAMSDQEYYNDERGVGLSDARAGWSGNFRGFTQYRKMIPGENRA